MASCIPPSIAHADLTARHAGAGRLLGGELLRIARCAAAAGGVVLCLLGLLQAWAAMGDGPIPAFQTAGRLSHKPLQVSHGSCLVEGVGADRRWAGLQPALSLLDEVNPAVADWVRATRASGRLVFTDQRQRHEDESNFLARYDAFSRRLTVSRSLFAECDGNIAVVLCHEYRHARQGLAKTLCYALSFVLRRDGDPAIIENDALLFEHEARAAIFGESSQSALARLD